MKIAIASGKGGTGKTTISTSLALTLHSSGKSISFFDCDVETPNAHLFLNPVFTKEEDVSILIPKIDEDLCIACGKCVEVCEFNAILLLGSSPLVFPNLCHGCGSCTAMCPTEAISEIPNIIGKIQQGETQEGIPFNNGVLNIGEPMAVPIISQLIKTNGKETQYKIYDSPPGTSCSVVEICQSADFVLLVTEPTPFGLHDLKLAVQLTQVLSKPTGVIINRDGIGNDSIEKYCNENNIPILLRIPYNRKISEATALGVNLIEIIPEIKSQYLEMIDKITNLVASKEIT